MNLIGQRFGMLEVIANANRKGYVVCKCDCGNSKDIRATSLTKTKQPTRSCGCKQRQVASSVGAENIAENSKEIVSKNRAFKTNIPVILCDKPKNNTSGHKGVSWNKEKGKWNAYIGIHRTRINLGYFDNIEDAVKARIRAEENYHQPIIDEINISVKRT